MNKIQKVVHAEFCVFIGAMVSAFVFEIQGYGQYANLIFGLICGIIGSIITITVYLDRLMTEVE